VGTESARTTTLITTMTPTLIDINNNNTFSRLDGRVGDELRDPAADLPGPVSARQRHPGRAGSAGGKNDSHAPRAKGEPARAQFTR
jgi:hypothetical protein